MDELSLQPIYLQLKENIIERIRAGIFPVGTSLPSERSLELMFNVSRGSVRKALDELIESGYIEKRPGRRSVITSMGTAEIRNMAFVTILDKSALLDIYRMFYEALLIQCNNAGINLYYVDVSRDLPSFLSTINFDALFISGNVTGTDRLDKIASPGTTMIALDDIFPQGKFTTVCTDNLAGGELAARHLIEIGCQRLLFFGVEPAYQYKPFRDRKSGFVRTAQLENIDYRILDIERDNPEQVEEELKNFLKQYSADGIFVFNDHLAMNTLRAFLHLNIKVPEDIAVIGFDGLEYGNFTTPTLTTIAQPIKCITAKALEVARSEKGTTRECVKIPGQLIERGSTSKNLIAEAKLAGQ